MTQDGDVVREMTAQEYADYQQLLAELEAQAAAADAKAAAFASARAKLAALGLTEAEVAALLGA
jgi:hypothetical protein